MLCIVVKKCRLIYKMLNFNKKNVISYNYFFAKMRKSVVAHSVTLYLNFCKLVYIPLHFTYFSYTTNHKTYTFPCIFVSAPHTTCRMRCMCKKTLQHVTFCYNFINLNSYKTLHFVAENIAKFTFKIHKKRFDIFFNLLFAIILDVTRAIKQYSFLRLTVRNYIKI